MKWLHFILSHSIFIAICAVALCFQTSLLLQVELPGFLYAFVFFSTLSSYNFYWLVSGYFLGSLSLPDFIRRRYTHIFIFILATAGMLFSMFKIPQLLPVIAAAIVLTLLYALPLLPFKIARIARKAGLLKTMLLAFTWAFVTVYIPYQQMPATGTITVILLFNNRFLFMLMLCIIFDARDTGVDKIRGLQSLTTMIKPVTVQYIMFVLFVIYIGNGIVLRLYYNEPVQIIALLITGVVALIIYFFSLQKQGYFFYYFLVDGLMLFSALATYVASI